MKAHRSSTAHSAEGPLGKQGPTARVLEILNPNHFTPTNMEI